MTAADIIKGFGGPTKLAKAIGLEPYLVWRWQKRGVPASKAVLVASVTGLTPHDVRPDIFPPSDGREDARQLAAAQRVAEQSSATQAA